MSETSIPKKRQTKKQKPELSGLLEAIRFISLAQRKEGESYKVHCKLAHNQATAFDGVIACGHKIDESLDAQPHTETLLKALSKSTEGLSITHVNNQLSIVSGKLKVNVPCDPTPLIAVKPDPVAGKVDGRLMTALAIVADLPEETEERLVCRSVLMQSGSVVGCRRGHVIIEAWHGIDMPMGLCVPIRAVKAILDSKKELQSFGFSDSSITFYFTDGAWIRTQLDEGKYPEYGRMLNVSAGYENIPNGFFEAVKDAAIFSDDGRIRLNDGSISSHSLLANGAEIQCDGIRGTTTFNVGYISFAKELATKADFYHDRGCFFIGEKDGVSVRGAIAKMVSD